MYKKITILIITMVLFICLSSCTAKHIEDTNGEDDFTVCTITDEDILKSRVNSISYKSKTTGNENRKTITIEKFSGVLKLCDLRFKGTNTEIFVDLKVTSGNAKIVLVSSKGIVHEVLANTKDIYVIEGQKDLYKLYLVGESAKLELKYEITK